jgi:TonB-dependent starch-binding outer membrane protein SusC
MSQARFVIGALSALLWTAPLGAQSATGTVRGRVIDAATQQTLSGVTVTIGGRGALTQADGRYSISGVPAGTDSVRARMLGYAPVAQVVTLAGGDTVTADLALAPQAVGLSEVVVIGYGQQSAGNLTGAVAQVGASQFNPGRIVSPSELIQAKVAGVQVVDNNEPGGGLQIRIRGTTSANASSEPLYVLDGVPLGTGGGISAGRDPLNFLNSADIQSITVLRDASAAAIYGANGSNGVVLITTKPGRRGGPQFEYTSSISASSVTRLPDMLNADQYRTAVATYAPAYLAQLGTANTNWFNEVSRTGYGHDHNLTVSGAGDKNTWRMSVGYLDQNGIIKATNAQRLSLGLNYSQRFLNNSLDLRANLRGSRTRDQFTPTATSGVLGNAATMGPTQPILDPTSPTGFYEWPNNSLTSGDNPVAILALDKSHGTTYRSVGNVQGDWHLPILKNTLTAHLNLAYDITQVTSVTFNPSITHAEQKFGYLGELWHNDNNMANTLLETYVSYAAPIRALMSGSLDLTAGYSWSGSHAEYTSLYETHLSTDLLGDNGIPTSTTGAVTNSSPIDESRLISFFGRANYNLNDRYLLALSLRRDGSSRFGANNAWGLFPSAAAAWRLSEESFLKNVGWLSDLKLRASYGKTGNQAFPNYLQYAAYLFGNPQAQVQFGNQFLTTIRPGAKNPNLKWESTGSLDIGFDFGLSNQRITGTIDWYDRKTTDMLFRVPVDPATNLSNFVWKNIGSMRNRGIEMSLRAQLLNGTAGALGWSADFTVAHNTNTVLSVNPADSISQIPWGPAISGGVGNTVQILTPGAPINAFFLCKQAYNATGKPIQGSYYNLAGDSVVTRCTDNRRVMHDPAPSVILGHSSYFTHGKVDVSFTLRAYLGNYVYNNIASASGDYRELTAGTSPYNLHASVLKTGFTQAQYLSDYYLEKASFLRMDNITVGYSFQYQGEPMRVYAAVQNAFTLTGYSGVDPTAGINGIDNNIYPRARTVSGGLTVRF